MNSEGFNPEGSLAGPGGGRQAPSEEISDINRAKMRLNTANLRTDLLRTLENDDPSGFRREIAEEIRADLNRVSDIIDGQENT